MSNGIVYRLDVLATNPEEINRIAARLKRPSAGLVDWVATREDLKPADPAQFVAELVSFEPVKNLFHESRSKLRRFRNFFHKHRVIAKFVRMLVSFKPVGNLFRESVNKARRFQKFFYKFTGIAMSHIFEISAEFPNAVFLLEYADEGESYFGKRVIRAGEVVQYIFDKTVKAQGQDWVLLDIFAPFVSEWLLGQPFGSLWTGWVKDAKKQLQELEGRGPTA